MPLARKLRVITAAILDSVSPPCIEYRWSQMRPFPLVGGTGVGGGGCLTGTGIGLTVFVTVVVLLTFPLFVTVVRFGSFENCPYLMFSVVKFVDVGTKTFPPVRPDRSAVLVAGAVLFLLFMNMPATTSTSTTPPPYTRL